MQKQIYDLKTRFDFGKYKGKSLEEVLQLNNSYVNWCLQKVEKFSISQEALAQIDEKFQYVMFSESALDRNSIKLKSVEAALEYDGYEEDMQWTRRCSDLELQMADWNYDLMSPAHDPSANPWIDVFGPGEEAEVAYWNTH